MTLKHTVLGVGPPVNGSVIQFMLPSLRPWFPRGQAGEERGKSPAGAGSLHHPPGQGLTPLPPTSSRSQSEPADHKKMHVCELGWVVFVLYPLIIQ